MGEISMADNSSMMIDSGDEGWLVLLKLFIISTELAFIVYRILYS